MAHPLTDEPAYLPVKVGPFRENHDRYFGEAPRHLEVPGVENFNVQCRSCERVFRSTVAVPRFGKPVFGEIVHTCSLCGVSSGYASWEHFRLHERTAEVGHVGLRVPNMGRAPDAIPR